MAHEVRRAPRATNLTALLEDARRGLVETETRNRLIHVHRSAKRANALDIVDVGWAKRIRSRSRWSMDRDGMQFGFFSFSKL